VQSSSWFADSRVCGVFFNRFGLVCLVCPVDWLEEWTSGGIVVVTR